MTGSMKILYGVQATGNGHLSKALEITPILGQYGEVDIFMSGIQSSIPFHYPVAFRKHGLSFIFGKRGNIDLISTLSSLKSIRLLYDISQVDVDRYDLILNDFEPITAWACKLKGRKCISLSHQAAFLSQKTPRPAKRSFLAEKLFTCYAPSSHYIGLHFKQYDDQIETPIIREEIRSLIPSEENHIAVYLPAYGDSILKGAFKQLPELEFKVFSKHIKSFYHEGNVSFFPTGDEAWKTALKSACGVIMGAGFEGPSEALYLKKKLMVLPMLNQYEQQCNAVALKEMGVESCKKISPVFPDRIRYWLKNASIPEVQFPFHSETLVKKIMQMA